MKVKITWWTPTTLEHRWLRRYSFSDTVKCAATGSYCNAMFDMGEADAVLDEKGYHQEGEKPPHDDPRWPKTCEACGRAFSEGDPYQLFSRLLYLCEATGDRSTLRDAPVGAVWDAWWISERRKDGPTGCGYTVGPDHRSLVCKLPGNHDWNIDARASNCTMPNDNTHHCWVRHGSPEDGTLHVDKNGHTCAAGAGSIALPNWHGFLHNGYISENG